MIAGNAKKTVENFGSVNLPRFIEMDDKERLKRIYSSDRKIKVIVRRLERLIAIKLKSYIDSADLSGSLSRDLERFVSWSLKLTPVDIKYWCDGISNLKLKRVSKTRVKLEAVSAIGPEDGSGKTFDCQLKGTFLLTSTRKNLKSYQVIIQGADLNFQLGMSQQHI